MSAPDGPNDPAEVPPRLLGAGFWAAIIVALLCVLAGIGVVVLGPRLWPAAH